MPQATTATTAPSAPAQSAGGGSEFTPLLRQIKEQGLLGRRTGWYTASIAVNAVALVLVAAGVLALGDTWRTLLLAPLLALFFTRTAFFGHDAGHSQISSSRRTNRLLGYLHGNFAVGMSSAWWNDKHNRHHANPNHLDKDPDVGVGVMVWTQAQAEKREGLGRWLTRNQARLFFPLLLLEGIALKVSSFQMVLSRSGWENQRRQRITEASLLVVHHLLYFGLLLTAMSVGKAVVFAFIHHALFGLHLGSVFAPNHKGMEILDSNSERWGHLRRQVLTSRNVRGGLVTDWMMGGLNYQVEHHLFPSMSRPHLRLAQPQVRRYCEERGVLYTETSLLDSYRQALTHMHEVGAPLRKRTSG